MADNIATAHADEASTETTTFHIIEPTTASTTGKQPHVPDLSAKPSVLLLNQRAATKTEMKIQQFIALKGTLYGYHVRANVTPKGEPDHVDWPDAVHIPQWIEGANEKIKELKKQRQVYLFNAGERMETVPPSVGGLEPDFDVRALSMKEAGASDEEIAKDRIYLGKLDGYGTVKNA